MNATGTRYLCIHGHFYQPPRENPWLEAVEVQDSAAPFHDWNERVTRECYAPNARARLVDGAGKIVQLLNNYAWMSFNFGPTLLSWMQDKAPVVLILFDASLRRAYWLAIQQYFQEDPGRQPRRGAKTVRVRVPKRQVVNRRAIARLRDLKREARGRPAGAET